jgi:hypothetical protein
VGRKNANAGITKGATDRGVFSFAQCPGPARGTTRQVIMKYILG